jgi:hypothetical protein
VAVIGSNNDGWQHYRMNLAELAPKGSGISTSGSFDRIIVTDVSGMGFNLLLDDVQLLTGLKNFRAAEDWLVALHGKATLRRQAPCRQCSEMTSSRYVHVWYALL